MRRSIAHAAVGAVSAATVLAATAGAFGPAGHASAQSASYARGSEVATPRGGALSLRAAPGSGRVLARVGSRTAFGSPTRLAVIRVRGGWLAVISDALRNGVRGYLRRSQVRLSRSPYLLEVDLSRRVLIVRRWGIGVRRVQITIGAASSPTPIGRFSITDKLQDFQPSVYGCCVLALSGHQTHLPPGWSGGNRLAIHGGGGIGAAVSNGCLHASAADLRFLMAAVPLGTLVIVHP
jgi:lipoprotein-anchoring transpeptidase ErfK/SrfK